MLLGFFFLAFVIFTSIIVFNKPLSRFTRATETFSVSTKDSLVFGWPLTQKADGKSQSVITVFIRNAEGKPMVDKVITAATSLGTVLENSATTNSQGKAELHLVSTAPGIATVTITIDNETKLDSRLSVKFE